MHAAALDASVVDKRPRCCCCCFFWWVVLDSDPSAPPTHPTHTHARARAATSSFVYSLHVERLDTTSVCFSSSSSFFLLFFLLTGFRRKLVASRAIDRPNTHSHTHTPARTRRATGSAKKAGISVKSQVKGERKRRWRRWRAVRTPPTSQLGRAMVVVEENEEGGEGGGGEVLESRFGSLQLCCFLLFSSLKIYFVLFLLRRSRICALKLLAVAPVRRRRSSKRRERRRWR